MSYDDVTVTTDTDGNYTATININGTHYTTTAPTHDQAILALDTYLAERPPPPEHPTPYTDIRTPETDPTPTTPPTPR